MSYNSGNDEIEILSSHNIEISENSGDRCNPSRDNLLANEIIEKKRKRIARVVCIVASIFVILICVLLGVSLSMTDNINEMVRNSNELLRKHSKSTLPPLPKVDIYSGNLTES